jgi:hypothetical protein
MSAEVNPDMATALLESAPIVSNQNAPFCAHLRTVEILLPNSRLDMYLYGSVSWQIPLLRTAKYDAVQWVDSPVFFRQFNPITLGDCSKAYLEYLDEQGKSVER